MYYLGVTADILIMVFKLNEVTTTFKTPSSMCYMFLLLLAVLGNEVYSGKDSLELQNQNPFRTTFMSGHNHNMCHLRILSDHQGSGHDILRYMRGWKYIPAFPHFLLYNLKIPHEFPFEVVFKKPGIHFTISQAQRQLVLIWMSFSQISNKTVYDSCPKNQRLTLKPK